MLDFQQKGKVKMGKIVLARHGQSKANAEGIISGSLDTPLTPKGESEADTLGRTVFESDLSIEHILCSPLTRAVETAKRCSRILMVPVTILPCLVERHHGILEGRHFSEIPELAMEYKVMGGLTYIIDANGAENYEALCARATNALEEIKQAILSLAITRDTLVICHAALMRAIVTVHRGKTYRDVFELHSVKNCGYVVLE